jgi:hypothetical protein
MRLHVPLLHAGLVFLVVPAAALPFSTPKLALLASAAVVLFVMAPSRSSLARTGALAWLAISALQGSPLNAAAALLLAALLNLKWDSSTTLRALVWIGAALAAITLVQAVGPGPRLRMYGTLGNPDFVAAWLGASICLALAQRNAPAIVLQAAALAVLGSFATALALAAAAAVALRRSAAIALLCLCAAWVGRDPVKVLQGRIELHQVAAPHLLDAPLTGLGSVEKLWPAAHPQNHVHDDWLELALEQGMPAALLLAALTVAALRKALQKKLLGPAAALASLAARAFVDFPLARPAELALFVTLIAVALREEQCTESSPSPSSPSP